MKNVLKVDFQKKSIIMDRTFAKNCADNVKIISEVKVRR